MLGIGGMQLYRAETPGPMKDNKLTPRITETAKALWYIYLGLTIACGLAYWLAGMRCSTPSVTYFRRWRSGLSTHDASMGYFNSPLIDMIAVVFMFLAGINFCAAFHRLPAPQRVRLLARLGVPFLLLLMAIVITFTVLGLYFTETTTAGRTPWSTACSRRCRSAPRPVSRPRSSTTGPVSSRSCCCSQFRRRLCRIDRRRHQGDPPAAAGQTGMREITRLVHPSAQHPGACGNEERSIRGSRRCGGSLPCMSPVSRADVPCPGDDRPRPDDRFQRQWRRASTTSAPARGVGAHYALMHDPASGSCVSRCCLGASRSSPCWYC